MSVQLNSYIHFKNETREAMDFYKSVFGGSVQADTFAKYDSAQMPVAPEDRDKIMHAYLKGDNGIELMASDTPSGMEALDEGSQMGLALNGDDEELLRGYFDKLSAGGQVAVPLGPSPWGDMFGMLTDKFGIEWMVAIGPVRDS
jgi:PhnB protein